MSEPLFTQPDEYQQMLNQGLKLSGEDRTYFIDGRVRALAALLPDAGAIRSLLDFGCGTGDAAPYLAQAMPNATLLGIDSAAEAIDHANEHFASDRIAFEPDGATELIDRFDLCYVNGVFHHVPPSARAKVLAGIRKALHPGGLFALFENNPWNPGTRMVMRRIPFDRDAITITPPEARRLLRDNGFEVVGGTSLFFFPRSLVMLRVLEPALRWTSLGAQYLVLARRTA